MKEFIKHIISMSIKILLITESAYSRIFARSFSNHWMKDFRGEIKHEDSNSVDSNTFDQITGVNNIFACGRSNDCKKIVQYAVSKNNSFNCNDEYLGIDIWFESANSTLVKKFAYLSPDSPMLQETQKTSKKCRKIKRYQVNDNHIIVSYGYNIDLVDKENFDEFIEWQLLLSYDIKRWIMYKLAIYDEVNDKPYYFKAFKDGIFYYVSFKAMIYIFKELSCLYICYMNYKETNIKTLKCKKSK